MVRAIDVANLLLAWAKENGDVITNLKLQKLLYYAQAWYLVNYNKRLFDDPIEAWDLGPVVRSIYRKWKQYGGTPIPYEPTGRESKVFQKHQIEFLKEYFRVFSNLSATALVSMTHSEDPWKNAYNNQKNSEIDTREMKVFYSRLYRKEHGEGK